MLGAFECQSHGGVTTRESCDNGGDIILTDPFNKMIIVQAKWWRKKIPPSVVRDVCYARDYENHTDGAAITTNSFVLKKPGEMLNAITLPSMNDPQSNPGLCSTTSLLPDINSGTKHIIGIYLYRLSHILSKYHEILQNVCVVAHKIHGNIDAK